MKRHMVCTIWTTSSIGILWWTAYA